MISRIFFLMEFSLRFSNLRPAVSPPTTTVKIFDKDLLAANGLPLSCSLCSRSFGVEILSASCSSPLEGKISVTNFQKNILYFVHIPQ